MFERYPCPYQWDLKQKVAEYRGVKKEEVFVGVGSDEAIDMLIRIACTPAVSQHRSSPPSASLILARLLCV